MFLVHIKTALTEAMKRTLDSEYVEADFRQVNVGIDYPVEQQDYPAVWVEFTPSAQLEIAGIDHKEVEGDADGFRQYSRWRFQGAASYTAVALTSLERDRLFDQLVRIMAFGRETPQTNEFRAYIEDNEFIAMNIDFDQIGVAGMATTPGTPWGTDDLIYEASIQMEVVGEFVSDGSTQTLVPLTAIRTYLYADNEPDPMPAGVWQ